MKCLYKAKEYDKTILYITKLVNIEGRTSEYMYILGKCYKAKNDYINARDSFALAIEINPKDYLSCYEFGLILDETNKKEVACAMFNKALKLNPDFYEAAEALGISFTSQGKFKKAINVYMKIVKKCPKSYEIYYNIGMLEMEIGNYEQSIEAFSKCIEIKPDLFMASYNIGNLCYMLKRYSEAIVAYKRIVLSSIYGAKAYYKMSIIFAIKEEYEKSLANLEYAVELDEHFLNKARKEPCFRKMRNQINELCESRERLFEKNRQKKNFMNSKFNLFKKNDGVRISL
jgi:tetratricopeptide (TPR) repeat protein